MQVIYEDNHILIVNKKSGEIVQGDKTGDTPLSEMVQKYLKEKYNKPGNVFIGVPHRLDRPTSGAVVFAKTSKALQRLNKMFQEGKVKKTYWAIVQHRPEYEEGELSHYIVRDEKKNKCFAYHKEKSRSKVARLKYKLINSTQNNNLIEVELMTGRHHQIRCQLSKIGSPIRGDIKYGAPESNKDGSISLHARRIKFEHPVSKEIIDVTAPVPNNDNLWKSFRNS